jgi:hypothetical protein
MKIYKVVADKRPKNCIECPMMGKYQCGEEHKVQATSGSAFYEKIPDMRCLIKESGIQH